MDKKNFRFYYGIVVAAVGLAVFYRTPQVLEQLSTHHFFGTKLFILRICFYILGVMLVVAGGIRIFKNYK